MNDCFVCVFYNYLIIIHNFHLLKKVSYDSWPPFYNSLLSANGLLEAI